MDPTIQKNIDDLIAEFKKEALKLTDPVAKLMVTALLHQSQKIKDEIAGLPDRIVSRLAEYFIPKNKISATPAMSLLQPSVKSKKGVESHNLLDGTFFTFKIDHKTNLAYYPLYRNRVIPIYATHLLSDKKLISKGEQTKLDITCKGKVWVGLEIPTEVDSLQNVSFYIKGTSSLMPEKISVGNEPMEIAFTGAENLSEIEMIEPFDSQQVNPTSIEMYRNWRRRLASFEDGCLIYITDSLKDRDAFKFEPYPKVFQQYLESRDLDKFENDSLWIQFDFGEGYNVPEDVEIIPNVMPCVNVNLNSVTLTPTSPIAKLTRDDGSSFLTIVETSLPSQKQGFGMVTDEVMVRDFDVNSYNRERLHRDVRNLYNRFIEDYHAFVEYHSLKDGELLRALRELVNKIGKSVQTADEIKDRYDDGTYAMRGTALLGKTGSVKVTYLTTQGIKGNAPKAGMLMENKKDAALEKDVRIITSAEGGEDKPAADRMYEMLRYYTLTSDRLFTKMDIDAFLRLQLLKEFGKEEIKRISHDIYIQGAGGGDKLVRGLYIDIKFKDEKNYRKALETALERKLHQMIKDRSCISMPIIINIVSPKTPTV